jgi:hypothetical protein
MNSLPKQLLLEVEKINETILSLENKKRFAYQKLSFYKNKIEEDNSHLIGKRAMCTQIDEPKPVECVCTAVLCLDDYSSVKPLFSRNGKKYIVDSYKWVE